MLGKSGKSSYFFYAAQYYKAREERQSTGAWWIAPNFAGIVEKINEAEFRGY